jgi:hypothetical protein
LGTCNQDNSEEIEGDLKVTDLKRLIKVFEFNEKARSGITLSDPSKIRLNTETSSETFVQLNAGFLDDGPFPTDTDLYVKTRITTPNGIKQWLFFEAVRDEPDGTEIKYRFDNGSRQIWWDGGAWATAGATDWNTEAEVQANFSTFPFDNNSISVISNLVTTSINVTPKLFEIRLLGLFEFEVLEDLFKSLMLKMFDEIRPVTDAAAKVLATTDTFDFTGDYKLQNSGYNIIDVPRIYNKTDDPLEKVNIAGAYTSGALNPSGRTNQPGSVTTTVPVDQNKIIKFKIQYVPEIADYTDEDYYETAKVPLITFEFVEEILRRDGLVVNIDGPSGVNDGIIIRDLTNMTAVQVLPPAQVDLRIGYAVFTDSSRDQKRLMEAVEKFLQRNKLLYSFAFDEPYTLSVVKRLEYEPKGAPANLRQATGEFDIRNVNLYEQPALDHHLVGNVNVEITT